MPELAPDIYRALALVKKAVGAVAKGQRNQQQGFNFRGIDDVVNATSGPLADNGVIVTPTVESFTYETVEIGRNKTAMGHVVGLVSYTFTGPLGDSVKATVLAESMDSGDKGAAKMMSVAYRIALLQVLTLPTDEKDPDHDVYERSSQNDSKSGVTRLPAASKAASQKGATDIQGLIKTIAEAKSADALNNAWKEAGALGVLQDEVTIPSTGEKLTIQKYLYDRADAIKSSPGSNGSSRSRAAASR